MECSAPNNPLLNITIISLTDIFLVKKSQQRKVNKTTHYTFDK